jgi:hypothetical protein
MKRHRRLITRAALTAVALFACAPAAAHASSLLSGYGGPGQGSQALLGSTLIGGSGGGGGSSASGGGSGSIAATQSAPTKAGGAHRGSGAGRHGAAGGAGAGSTAATTGSAAAFRAAETGAGSSTLGLSGAGLVYILAVLGGLVLVAVLTRSLARGARQGAPD